MAIDPARHNANCEIKHDLENGLGSYLLYRLEHLLVWRDGVQLSGEDMNIFLADPHQGLREALGLSVGLNT